MWNYRKIEFDEGDSKYFEIKEVYYRDEDEGSPYAYCNANLILDNDSSKDSEELIKKISVALGKPALKDGDFGLSDFIDASL